MVISWFSRTYQSNATKHFGTNIFTHFYHANYLYRSCEVFLVSALCHVKAITLGSKSGRTPEHGHVLKKLLSASSGKTKKPVENATPNRFQL